MVQDLVMQDVLKLKEGSQPRQQSLQRTHDSMIQWAMMALWTLLELPECVIH